jgi:hypothetical protein
MSPSVELLQIDRRHEACRVRDIGREARLLANVAQRGIERPLDGVWKNAEFILLDGFKRLRVAERLKIHVVPCRSLGEEETVGIVRLMQRQKQSSLNAFEEARFIERLIHVHQMSVTDIATELNRSKAWVSTRRGLLTEMTSAIWELLSQGKFPVHAYLHTLRPFTRVNGVSSAEIEQFIRALAGQSVSLRDIQLLADSCFRGPASLRDAILGGNWRWSLQQIKDTLGRAGACSTAEQQLLSELSRVSKLLVQLTSRCANARHSTPAFLVEADLLAGAILSQLPNFQHALERLCDRS